MATDHVAQSPALPLNPAAARPPSASVQGRWWEAKASIIAPCDHVEVPGYDPPGGERGLREVGGHGTGPRSLGAEDVYFRQSDERPGGCLRHGTGFQVGHYHSLAKRPAAFRRLLAKPNNNPYGRSPRRGVAAPPGPYPSMWGARAHAEG